MATYDSSIAAAQRLIAKKGGPATLKRHTPGAVDPVTQTETGAADASYAIRTVALPTGAGKHGKNVEFVDGTLVQKVVQTFYIAAVGLAITPQPGDVITFNGRDYALLAVTTYNPAGDGAIYHEAKADI